MAALPRDVYHTRGPGAQLQRRQGRHKRCQNTCQAGAKQHTLLLPVHNTQEDA